MYQSLLVPKNNNGLERDTFVREQNSPFFTSVNAEMKTLRKYADVLGNAYSMDNVLSKETYDYIFHRIKGMRSDLNALNLISRYKKILEGVELKVLNYVLNELRRNKKSTINEVINARLNKSYRALVPEISRVIWEIKDIISTMPESKRKLRANAIVESWERDLLAKDYDAAIIQDKYPNILRKMKLAKREQTQKDSICEALGKLPNTTDNFDAFIVNCKDVSRKVFVKRLLTPYLVSIEHVIPRSRGGHANSIGNCILVRTKDNIDRGSDRMLDKHPERTEFLISYFRRAIEKINQGGMRDILWYPFEVKKSIEQETLNKVNLDKELEMLTVTREEAYKTFKA